MYLLITFEKKIKKSNLKSLINKDAKSKQYKNYLKTQNKKYSNKL